MNPATPLLPPSPGSASDALPGDPSRDQTLQGSDYTPEEVEFLRAMDAYRTHRRRPFPTWTEALAVLRSLGYRKGTAS